MIGRDLRHFRITAKLGEGGMGEVYRARDSRLGREVAIKVLPEAFVADGERMRRFEREARLLASLNHPHIASIYDVGEDDGVHFLVMELVEGETLAERLSRGPVPWREAADLAIQIAEALEAAHARGIVHRDLKPANVSVDEDGRVKVLDFGLAKALAPEVSGDAADGSEARTLSYQATETGVVLGTAAYMSPEQARGKAADSRSDVWAFGCLLYEMVTGRRPFDGDSAADIVGAVVSAEPDWAALPRSLPRPLRRLLRRCLAKEPKERLHHIADARLELADALDGPREPSGEAPSVAGWRGAPAAILAPALVLGAVLGGGAVWLFGPEPRTEEPVATPSRWTVDVSGHGQLDLGGRSNPLAVSPDGSVLAYVARSADGSTRLYVREIDALEARGVPGSEGARNPFFSPDGRWLGFFAGARLKKASVAGGAPVNLATVPLDNLGATWSRAGTIVFASYSSGLWKVADTGGEPELLTPAEEVGSAQHRWPWFLPGGRKVLFTLQTLEGPRLAILDLGSLERTLVPGVQQVAKARYLAGGALVFAQEGSLLGARFDPEEGRLLDTPTPLVSGVSMEIARGSANFEVSATGTLVYVSGQPTPGGTLTWVDRSGHEETASHGGAPFTHPRLSPDGTEVAVTVGSEVGDRELQIFDLQRGTRRVMATEARIAQAVWHPDGDRMALVSDRAGNYDLYLAPVSLIGNPAPLLIRPLEQWLCSWTPDGEELVFYEIHPETARDLWILDLGNDGATRPYRATPANERGGRLSPDGRWLAYVSNESGRDEVYVESFPEPGTRWTISTHGGTEPVWSRDGTELFYREGRRMMAVSVQADARILDPSLPSRLFEGSYNDGIVGNAQYEIGPDGRFLMIRQEEPSSSQLHVVLHWDRELRSAVGGGLASP